MDQKRPLKLKKKKKKDKFLTMSAPQLSASSNKRKLVELSTSCTIDPQSNLQFNNTCIPEEKIRYERLLKVMSHPLSKYFKAAARDVINKKGGIATVAQKYELNTEVYHDILGNRIEIRKHKRDYLEEKDLRDRTDKIAESVPFKHSGKYKFDKLTNNRILTYGEEDSILKDLPEWLNYQLSRCRCLICAMEFLCTQACLAYKRRKISSREWNIQMEIKWLCEFEVRYDKELSKYFSDIQFSPSIDSSDMTEETLQKYARKE